LERDEIVTSLDKISATQFGAAPENADRLPGWLRDAQSGGRKAFGDWGLPTKRVEDWKYTDLSDIARLSFLSAHRSDARFDADWMADAPFADVDGYRITIINGRLSSDFSNVGNLVGVDAIAFRDLGAEDPDWVRDTLRTDFVGAEDAMSALTLANMQDGYCIRIQAGVRLEKPIVVVNYTQGLGGEAIASSYARHVIVVEEGAEAVLLEAYCGDDRSSYFQNVGIDVRVEAGGAFGYAKMQAEAENARHLARMNVRLARDSAFQGFVMTLGGALARHEARIVLGEPNAKATLNGALLGAGDQHSDITTVIDHVAPDCRSAQKFKAVLDERARGVFQGRVTVHRDAQRSDGRQSINSLLLSDRAEIDAKPELKIFADDVKCAHGATSGDLDEDALFYLRARGIDEESARGLLILAFLDDVVEGAPEIAQESCAVAARNWLAKNLAGVRVDE
jgi:Fe-S cluster assembly protein SufD